MSGKKRASHRQPLIFSVIEDLKRKGYNQTEIANMHGTTRAAVSWHVRNYGKQQTTRQLVGNEWPWETEHIHSKAKPFQRLRDHGEYVITGGKGMSDDKISRLRSFYKKLREEGLVVEFDPELPPEPGVSAVGGFAYRKRVPEDGDLLIRVNKNTNITEQGKRLWSFPPVEP